MQLLRITFHKMLHFRTKFLYFLVCFQIHRSLTLHFTVFFTTNSPPPSPSLLSPHPPVYAPPTIYPPPVFLPIDYVEIKIHFSGIIRQNKLHENNLFSFYYKRKCCLNWLHIIDYNGNIFGNIFSI